MHHLHLTEDGWIQRFLLSQPESGIGYQEVELYLKDGRIIPVTIWNAEIVQFANQYNHITEKDILKVILNEISCNNPDL